MQTKKGKIIFLLGGPGCGKSTQGIKFQEKYNEQSVHLSAGQLLRNELENKTEQAKIIQGYLDTGEIVPGEITVGLLKKAIQSTASFDKKIFIIDGFPRTKENLDIWKKLCDDNFNVVSLIHFICEDEENVLIPRILKRFENDDDDKKRSDDNKQTALNKLRVYKEETSYSISYYKSIGKCTEIDVNRTIEDIFSDFESFLKKFL